MGAFGDPNSVQARVTYWRNMERAHYPYAHEMVEEVEAQMQDEMAQMQMQIGNLEGQVGGLQNDLKSHEEYEAYLRGGR